MSGAFQPFSTTDSEGQLTGFDADVAMEIAQRLQREGVLVQTDWSGIQAGLQSSKYDLICGSMAITPARLKVMHFSLPYYVSGAQVFAREGVAKLTGIRIGVTEDSTYASYIQKNPNKFQDSKVIYFGSEAEIIAAMNTDKIDAFISDRIVGGFYILKGSSIPIKPLGKLLYEEACGIAARLDSAGLVREVNGALFSMIQDGAYARIYRKWVGTEPNLELLLAHWGEFAKRIPQLDNGSKHGNEEARNKVNFAQKWHQMILLLIRGAWITVQLTFWTSLLALLFGIIIGVGSVSQKSWVRFVSRAYSWTIRGVPLMVQLFVSYFLIATMVNHWVGSELMGALTSALLALVINTTAYNAETIRGGIQSLDRGQWDAARALGMRETQVVVRIILPQALKVSIPSLCNNLIVLIKDTSLVGAITLTELTYSARNIIFQTGQTLEPLLLAALFYLLIISAVTYAINRWEDKLFQQKKVSNHE